MICADVFRQPARMMQLAEILFLKSDRESFDSLGRFLGHQCDHGARIDAAGKKGAQRNFRHQANTHGLPQQIDHALACFLFADV